MSNIFVRIYYAPLVFCCSLLLAACSHADSETISEYEDTNSKTSITQGDNIDDNLSGIHLPQTLTSKLSPHCTSVSAIKNTYQAIASENPALNKTMVDLGVRGYCFAVKNYLSKLHNLHYLTLIDFTLPSDKKRFFIIDLETKKIISKLHVAHGMRSGGKYATHFSNQPQTHTTSLGVYITQDIYTGKHGRSLRLIGLEQGINNNALRREVVIHSAPYMSDQFIGAHARAGRSWGCFALSKDQSNNVIQRLRNGSVIFAYALPEQKDKNL